MKNYFKRSCMTLDKDNHFDKHMEHVVFFDDSSLKDTTRAWLEITVILDMQRRSKEADGILHKDGIYFLSVYRKMSNIGPWSELKVILT